MRKRFRITLGAITPNKGYPFRKMLLRFIREWLWRKQKYESSPSYSPPKLIKTTRKIEEEEYYRISYTADVRYVSPYFYIKDVDHYEEKESTQDYARS